MGIIIYILMLNRLVITAIERPTFAEIKAEINHLRMCHVTFEYSTRAPLIFSMYYKMNSIKINKMIRKRKYDSMVICKIEVLLESQ